jgi:hypothetical protein
MIALSGKRRPIVLMIAGALALGGCASTVLPKPGTGAPAIGPIAAVEMKAAPIKGADARFAFVRISGAPGDVLTGLSAALNKEARARNITLVPEEDVTATYKVKGYVSAVGGPTGTLLVYVFDVLDSHGVRIHRVSGQERGGPATSDPWGGILPPTVASAARHAIDDLAAWVNAV